MQELRTAPRQRRSQQSIDSILDAAERLIHAQGQVAFTAKELADEAGTSIGRVYYWYKDIPAVVTALVDRSAYRLVQLFADSVGRQVGKGLSERIHNVIGDICRYVDENPAVVALCLTGGVASPGESLSDQLVSFVSVLVRERVPGISEPETAVVARTAVGIMLGMLTGYSTAGDERPFIQQELVYVLGAYMMSRFPPPDDDVWTRPSHLIQPARPSRVEELASNKVLWPALAPDQH
jgi:AcrR family transcriptional regulator